MVSYGQEMIKRKNKMGMSLPPEGLLPLIAPSTATAIFALVDAFLEVPRDLILITAPSHLPQNELALLQEQMDCLFALPWNETLPKNTTMAAAIVAGRDITAARHALGKDALLLVWANTVDEAIEVADRGADLILFGPIFAAEQRLHKQSEDPVGSDTLADLCTISAVPIVAWGGIDAGNLLLIKDAGAYGFCALADNDDPDQTQHNAIKLQTLWEDVGE